MITFDYVSAVALCIERRQQQHTSCVSNCEKLVKDILEVRLKKTTRKNKKNPKILEKKLQNFWHYTQTQKPLHEYYPAAIETSFITKLMLDGKVQNSTLILNTKIYRKWAELQMKMCFLRQLGLKIVNKFSNSTKMGFSVKFFTVDLSESSFTNVNFTFLAAG